ncbi:hypothetical protein MGSAQ_001878, partial [marine sediment metagenome]
SILDGGSIQAVESGLVGKSLAGIGAIS